MRLIFEPSRLPRAMTRPQWREVDRWRRVVQARLRQNVEAQTYALIIYGSTHPACIDIIERLIRPPLMFFPDRVAP